MGKEKVVSLEDVVETVRQEFFDALKEEIEEATCTDEQREFGRSLLESLKKDEE